MWGTVAPIWVVEVVEDIVRITGQNLMKLLVSKESSPTFSEVEDCLRGSLREKARELHRSVMGFFEEHHRYLLAVLLDTIEKLERQIEVIEGRIRQVLKTSEELIDRLKEIPGIGDVSAHSLLAEIGPTLEAFPSAPALAVWCGLCPGNNQSGGKRFSGKSPVRKHHLKTIMVEIAWSAIKKKVLTTKPSIMLLRRALVLRKQSSR